jgi:hypothetical protein
MAKLPGRAPQARHCLLQQAFLLGKKAIPGGPAYVRALAIRATSFISTGPAGSTSR